VKLAIIGPTYPNKGGISHFTTLLVKELRKHNEVLFISWRGKYLSFVSPVKQVDESNDAIATENENILNIYNPFSWMITAARVSRSKPQKVVFTWYSSLQAPMYGSIALYLRITSRARLVFVCHNVLPHELRFYDRFLGRLVLRMGDEYIVHSVEEHKDLVGLIGSRGLIAKRSLPIYNDVFNSKSFNSVKLKKELKLKSKVLLFFGYIRPYKGLGYLLEAMPTVLLTYPDTTLLVVGESWGSNKKDLLTQVAQLKITSNITFIDSYVPNEEVGKYFSVCDIVVLPYVSVTQSGVVPIAYSFHKPVISTNVGGLKEVVVDGKTGYLVPPENPPAIAEAIIKFYKSPFKIAPESQYSWGSYTEALLAEGTNG
jgi:glycosyltransferase involved in cell wall biosynthesis